MISKMLTDARGYEESEALKILDEERPALHLSPRTGWLNDPNGFSYYDGKYHLFYQYNPYDSFWNRIHWGHAVSSDLIRWEYLPCAIAPDEKYDADGCFSGSAVTLKDGRQLLMYTGVVEDGSDPEGLGRYRQTQNVAVSSAEDGCNNDYDKYDGNPVIDERDLPDDGDIYECRDPYLYQVSEDSYRALISCARKSAFPSDVKLNGKPRGGTRILEYRSDDGFRWEYNGVLFEDDSRIGIMWECPSIFALEGKQILMASPMDMEAEEADGTIRFPKGNNVCYIIGDKAVESSSGIVEFLPERDESGRIVYNPVDMGLDFYASQVLPAPDGRIIMIAWMQDPATSNYHDDSFRFFGQMTLPRELNLEGDRLVQKPVRELDRLRSERAVYKDVTADNSGRESVWFSLPEINGRILDLEITVRPVSRDEIPERERKGMSPCTFGIRFAASEDYYTELWFDGRRSELTIDRSHSGQESEMTSCRTVKVRRSEGAVDLRIVLDRFSAEIFINNGEQVMSVTYYTPSDANNIEFRADEGVSLDISAYRLNI